MLVIGPPAETAVWSSINNPRFKVMAEFDIYIYYIYWYLDDFDNVDEAFEFDGRLYLFETEHTDKDLL